MNFSSLRHRRLFALTTLVLVPLRAAALETQIGGAPVHLDVSETAVTRWHVDNGNVAPRGSLAYDPTGSNFGDLLDRLQVDASRGQWFSLLRLDGALFGHVPTAAPGDSIDRLLQDRYANRIDLEKIAVGYAGKNLELTLGDFYVSLGRGLVLSLRKIDEFGIDTTLRGASSTIRVQSLTLKAVGGVTNIVNNDESTGRQVGDPNDVVLGGAAEYRIGTIAIAGVQAADFRYQEGAFTSPTLPVTEIRNYGGSFEIPDLLEHGAFYAELDGQRRESAVPHQGWAAYGSLNAFFGKWNALLEAKDYADFQPVRTSLDSTRFLEFSTVDFYNSAPTLERVSQALKQNANIVGARLRLDARASEKFSPYASMGFFRDRIDNYDIFDPYAGVQIRWESGRASVSGGWRIDRNNALSREPGGLYAREWHVELDVAQPITGAWNLELAGFHRQHREAVTSFRPWSEGQSTLALRRGSTWTGSVGFEYSTESPEVNRPYQPNAGLQWQSDDTNNIVRLFAGGQRAGLKCVNGVCRNYPGFNGARIEVVLRR